LRATDETVGTSWVEKESFYNLFLLLQLVSFQVLVRLLLLPPHHY
jgi:hypothetical protein